MSSLPEMYSQSLRAQPEGCRNIFQANLQVPMLQLLCKTSKAHSLDANMSASLYPLYNYIKLGSNSIVYNKWTNPIE